jgi:glycosyltransferase involved in cell wall biosynthesis
MNIISLMGGRTKSYPNGGIPNLATLIKGFSTTGHKSLLAVGGSIPIGDENFMISDPASFFDEPSQSTFGLTSFPAIGKYGFSTKMFPTLVSLAPKINFITLHSLYSFPVIYGYLIARTFRIPYVVWFHGVFGPAQRLIGARKKKIYNMALTRQIVNHSASVVLTSQIEREQVKNFQFQAPSVIIPHGVDMSRFSLLRNQITGRFRNKYLNSFKGKVFLYISRINPVKGLDLVIEAFSDFARDRSDVRLVIVGAPDPLDYINYIQAMISKFGLEEKVVLTGALYGDEKLQALADADYFVLTSHNENFSYAMFEAIASSLPVIVSDAMSFSFEVEKNQCGLVVQRNPKSISEAFSYLANQPVICEMMKENGKKVIDKYSLKEAWRKSNLLINAIARKNPIPQELLPEYL